MRTGTAGCARGTGEHLKHHHTISNEEQTYVAANRKQEAETGNSYD